MLFLLLCVSHSLPLVIVIIFVGWPRCGFCLEIETEILSLLFVQAHTRCILFHALAHTLCKMSSRIFENIWRKKTTNKNTHTAQTPGWRRIEAHAKILAHTQHSRSHWIISRKWNVRILIDVCANDCTITDRNSKWMC